LNSTAAFARIYANFWLAWVWRNAKIEIGAYEVAAGLSGLMNRKLLSLVIKVQFLNFKKLPQEVNF